MSSIVRVHCLLLLSAIMLVGRVCGAQESATTQPSSDGAEQANGQLSIEEIRSLLDAIDPYLPDAKVATEIDVFGSTTMDAMVHGWTHGFKKFHPDATIIISAEGSEAVFERLAKNPASIGMLSRPVTAEELEKLKSKGLKSPVAVQVARDALGVFVHESNPLQEITYPQLAMLFCSEDAAANVTWDAVGVTGDLADQPVHRIGRDKMSGTRKFVEDYLFHSLSMRTDEEYLESNAEVLQAIADDPTAIGIADLKSGNDSVRRLNLRDKTALFSGDEHNVLLGRYPIIRPLTLVFDLGQTGEKAAANRELVRYALTRTGQMQAILAGFFPSDPATLRGERAKLDVPSADKVANAARDSEPSK